MFRSVSYSSRSMRKKGFVEDLSNLTSGDEDEETVFSESAELSEVEAGISNCENSVEPSSHGTRQKKEASLLAREQLCKMVYTAS